MFFDSWKSWERGTPELAFEILSPSDSPERWTFEEKLLRYRALGVSELVVFHVDGDPGARLRVWDRIDGNLVERAVSDESTPCLTLDAFLVVAPVDDLPACVRLASDAAGPDLYPTAEGARLVAEAGAGEREADARRDAEADARRPDRRATRRRGRGLGHTNRRATRRRSAPPRGRATDKRSSKRRDRAERARRRRESGRACCRASLTRASPLRCSSDSRGFGDAPNGDLHLPEPLPPGCQSISKHEPQLQAVLEALISSG